MTTSQPRRAGQYLQGYPQLFQDEPATRIQEGGEGDDENWWCDTCGYVLVAEYPGARAAIEARGMPLHMAQCKCSNIERQARRDRDATFVSTGLPASRNTFSNFQPRPGTPKTSAETGLGTAPVLAAVDPPQRVRPEKLWALGQDTRRGVPEQRRRHAGGGGGLLRVLADRQGPLPLG